MEDEELALKLQSEFDKEARNLELQCEKDFKLAQKLASSSHDISESESDEDIIPLTSNTVSSENDNQNVVSENLSESASNDVVQLVSDDRKRPICQYASNCYRKNPSHLAEFYHPESSDAPPKKSKLAASEDTDEESRYYLKPFDERLTLSEPYRFFLNKVYSVPETQRDWQTLVFPDLLNPKLGTLVESAQITFMVDLDFVMQFYEALNIDKIPLLFVYGELDGNPKSYGSITCSKVHMPYQYGVHHSKMMLLLYEEGFRVVVHTANLVPDDWSEKTQGFWISPLFPKLSGTKSSLLEGESKTGFKKDLTEYLLSYKNSHLDRWSRIVRDHDFSACRVHFLGSVPGYHTGDSRFRFGHLKCRQLLRKSNWKVSLSLPVIIQCSSIGSLGKEARSWLTGELGSSLMGGNSNTTAAVKLIYPSEDDVSNSSQGYGGGSCLPYNSETHKKQLWLKNHMHHWRSVNRLRSRAMPHVKSYTRLSANLDSAQFFLLTSSNLSKAAWGQLQKQETQIFIRSYEAGVLWLPEYVTESDSFPLKSKANPKGFLLPYDVPLTTYSPKSIPWFKNTSKSSPDVLGETYIL